MSGYTGLTRHEDSREVESRLLRKILYLSRIPLGAGLFVAVVYSLFAGGEQKLPGRAPAAALDAGGLTGNGSADVHLGADHGQS